MPTEVKMELRKRSDGTLRVIISSVDKPIKQMLLNRKEYYEKAKAYLDKAGKFDRIRVEINSQGGSLDSAIGITTALCQRHEDMRILIDGRCDSAATLLLELPAPVYITQNSGIYIHSPCTQRYQRQKNGEYKLIQTESFALKMAKSYFSAAYRIRGKQSGKKIRRRDIRMWLARGARFAPQEAVDAGLCCKVMSRVEFEKG